MQDVWQLFDWNWTEKLNSLFTFQVSLGAGHGTELQIGQKLKMIGPSVFLASRCY